MTEHKTAMKVLPYIRIMLHLPDSLASAKGQLNFLLLINGDEELVPQRKMNLTVKEQKNLPLKLTEKVLELQGTPIVILLTG